MDTAFEQCSFLLFLLTLRPEAFVTYGFFRLNEQNELFLRAEQATFAQLVSRAWPKYFRFEKLLYQSEILQRFYLFHCQFSRLAASH